MRQLTFENGPRDKYASAYYMLTTCSLEKERSETGLMRRQLSALSDTSLISVIIIALSSQLSRRLPGHGVCWSRYRKRGLDSGRLANFSACTCQKSLSLKWAKNYQRYPKPLLSALSLSHYQGQKCLCINPVLEDNGLAPVVAGSSHSTWPSLVFGMLRAARYLCSEGLL